MMSVTQKNFKQITKHSLPIKDVSYENHILSDIQFSVVVEFNQGKTLIISSPFRSTHILSVKQLVKSTIKVEDNSQDLAL